MWALSRRASFFILGIPSPWHLAHTGAHVLVAWIPLAAYLETWDSLLIGWHTLWQTDHKAAEGNFVKRRKHFMFPSRQFWVTSGPTVSVSAGNCCSVSSQDLYIHMALCDPGSCFHSLFLPALPRCSKLFPSPGGWSSGPCALEWDRPGFRVLTHSALVRGFLEGSRRSLLFSVASSCYSSTPLWLRDFHWGGMVVFLPSVVLTSLPFPWSCFLPRTREESSQKEMSNPPSPSLLSCHFLAQRVTPASFA